MTKQAWVSILLMMTLLLGAAGAALADTQNDDMDILTYSSILFGFDDSDYSSPLPRRQRQTSGLCFRPVCTAMEM